MLIHHINLNHLNVFVEVFEGRSMTSAAERLHLTQSGVSQHMRSLEDSLGVKLFDRVNQKIIPTSAANLLYKSCTESFKGIEKTLRIIKGDDSDLSGSIPLGMPVEFGNNLVLPLLSQFGKKYPNVSFEIYFDFADSLNHMLLEGTIDFAFVDDYKMDKRIQTNNVYTERLYLCCSATYFKEHPIKKEIKDYFESLDYVDYKVTSPILNMWFEHHYKQKITVDARAIVMDANGVAKFITSDFGLGILPLHVIRKLEDNGEKIHIFKGSDKVLLNKISLACIENKTLTLTSDACMSFLTKELKNINL